MSPVPSTPTLPPTGPPPGSPGTAVTVSAVIPAYNAAAFIGRAVSSVLSQSRPPDEVVVVNDGSPDTVELEAALAPFAQRVIYLKQDNRGPSAARNLGILHSSAEYVGFLDSDDAWMPGFLSAQLTCLAQDPATDLIYSNGEIVGDTPLAGRDLMSVAPSRGDVTFESLVSGRCTVLASCIVARRQALIDAGLFDGRFRRAEDFHLWARVAHRGGRIRYHQAVLVQHTRRAGSLSHDLQAMARGAIAVLQDLSMGLPLTARESALVHERIARLEAELALHDGRHQFVAGRYAAAAAAIGRAASLDPGRWQRVRLRALQLGLQLAPELLRRTYGMLRRPLAARHAESA